MKTSTAKKLAISFQLYRLDGVKDCTTAQLSGTSGVSKKTIQRNSDTVNMIDFALSPKEVICVEQI